MTAIQYGVQYDGDKSGTYVAAMFNRTAAESVLAAHSLPGWLPRAVRVVRRDVGEWTPAPSPVPNEGSGPTAVTHPKGHTA